MRFEGKVAVITGGGQGLGSAFASALVEEGARVALLDVNELTAQETAEALEARGFNALGLHCDVTDDAAVDRAMGQVAEHFGALDILVNNAGLHQRKYNQPFGSLERHELRALFEVNVMGIINCSLACQPFMASAGGGVITNIASTSANASATPYGVSKLAARGLTVALATEMAADNIRVNAISPGFVGSSNLLAECDPERLKAIMAALGASLPAQVVDKCSQEDLVEIVRGLQLLRNEGTVDDVVQALLYLSSEAAGFVTGETLRIAGGSTIGF
jgi:NAD(P)-dependent dehydrogenase (short-subunit alcohol dehydrogenase family)